MEKEEGMKRTYFSTESTYVAMFDRLTSDVIYYFNHNRQRIFLNSLAKFLSQVCGNVAERLGLF
jgi:hypothetical protein